MISLYSNWCFLESEGLFSKRKTNVGDSASINQSMYVPSRIEVDCLSTSSGSTVYPDDGPFAYDVQDKIR